MLAYTSIEKVKFSLLDKPKQALIEPTDAVVRVTLGCRIDGGQTGYVRVRFRCCEGNGMHLRDDDGNLIMCHLDLAGATNQNI